MNISKDELYQIAKESVEKKTEPISCMFGCIVVVAFCSIFVGVIFLNLRLILGSIIAIVLVRQLNKIFEKSKQKIIEKVVEEYDEKEI